MKNILETRAYRISDGRQNTSYKELAKSGGAAAYENFHTEGKRKI